MFCASTRSRNLDVRETGDENRVTVTLLVIMAKELATCSVKGGKLQLPACIAGLGLDCYTTATTTPLQGELKQRQAHYNHASACFMQPRIKNCDARAINDLQARRFHSHRID